MSSLPRFINAEVKVDGEAIELTAAGGDVIESDKAFEYLVQEIQKDVKTSLTKFT